MPLHMAGFCCDCTRTDLDSPTGSDAQKQRIASTSINLDLGRVCFRWSCDRARNVAGIAGTGIGLSAAKQIVEQHGGRLDVDRPEGAGSTFTVRLPLSAQHR
jgi:hypothetical protein